MFGEDLREIEVTPERIRDLSVPDLYEPRHYGRPEDDARHDSADNQEAREMLLQDWNFERI